MLPRKLKAYLAVSLFLHWAFGMGGCTTTTLSPAPVPPIYTQVPHPVGMDVGDLAAIFLDPKAPKAAEFSKTCDVNFQKLNRLTQSKGEITDGARELVRTDPVHYHWCFYSKVQSLDQDLTTDTYWEEKQKRVLDTYEFLVPIAKAFNAEFHDSRYFRWAVVRYRKLSEWVFFRKLELTPAGTMELVQPSNPFGVWRSAPEKLPVLEKYQIITPSLSASDPGMIPPTPVEVAPTPGVGVTAPNSSPLSPPEEAEPQLFSPIP